MCAEWPTSWRPCASRAFARRGQLPGRRGRGERGQGPRSTWLRSPSSTASSPRILAAWLDYLGIGTGGGAAVKIDTPLTAKIDELFGL